MTASLRGFLEHIGRLAGRDCTETVGDGALLGRYRCEQDEPAFAAIVARHGPMVMGVCRRLVPDAQGAEDAFQATFLVLARKADTIHPPSALAGWLYGVARRIALKARTRLRPVWPREDGHDPPARGRDPLDELSVREMMSLLDDELARLPEVYRLPILLCCMEG